MAKHNDGGPAFPQSCQDLALMPVTDAFGHDLSSGMSLRDWFAGQIAAASIVNAAGIRPNTSVSKEAFTLVAEVSYELADAMLAARLTGDQR